MHTRQVAPTFPRQLHSVVLEHFVATERSEPIRIPLECMQLRDRTAGSLVAIQGTKAGAGGVRCV